MRIIHPNQMGRFVAPLNPSQFTLYVLVPHIACILIQEDFSCDAHKAYKIMTKSADDGASLYPADEGDDDDDELDKVVHSNFRAARLTKPSYDSDIEDPTARYEVVENVPKDNVIVNAAASTSKQATAAVPRARPKPRRIRRLQLLDLEGNNVRFGHLDSKF